MQNLNHTYFRFFFYFYFSNEVKRDIVYVKYVILLQIIFNPASPREAGFFIYTNKKRL